MRHHARAGESGQVSAEFGLIVAAVAIGCILTFLIFSGVLRGKFDSSTQQLPQNGQFLPPNTTGELTYPTSVEECASDGWKQFPQFRDEAACRAYFGQ